MSDKLVIDIETKNTFADVGGQRFLTDLDVSLTGVYSYNRDEYSSFKDDEMEKLGELLKGAGLIIGFSINRFDIPILNKYLNFDLLKIKRFDILDEMEVGLGRRVGLDVLARANLGIGKTSHGLEAIEFYKNGDWKSLADYCINDVKITKDLYELIKKRGHLSVPERETGNMLHVNFNIEEPVFYPTLF